MGRNLRNPVAFSQDRSPSHPDAAEVRPCLPDQVTPAALHERCGSHQERCPCRAPLDHESMSSENLGSVATRVDSCHRASVVPCSGALVSFSRCWMTVSDRISCDYLMSQGSRVSRPERPTDRESRGARVKPSSVTSVKPRQRTKNPRPQAHTGVCLLYTSPSPRDS